MSDDIEAIGRNARSLLHTVEKRITTSFDRKFDVKNLISHDYDETLENFYNSSRQLDSLVNGYSAVHSIQMPVPNRLFGQGEERYPIPQLLSTMLVPEYEKELMKLYDANKDISKEEFKKMDSAEEQRRVEEHNKIISRILEGYNQHLDDCRDEIAEKGFIAVIDPSSSQEEENQEKEEREEGEAVMDVQVQPTTTTTTTSTTTAVTASVQSDVSDVPKKEKKRKRSNMFRDLL
jgi:hypothetical protein